MKETLHLLRGGSVVTSLFGSFGHGLRETRLTATLGYMLALWAEGFQKLFSIKGDIRSVSLEHNHENDRSDIFMETSEGNIVVEAKVTGRNPKAQARKYPAARRIIISRYLPSFAERQLKRCQYVTWHDVATFIEEQCLAHSSELKIIGLNLLSYMEEHHMIQAKSPVEIYAREINEESTLQLLLHGRIYICGYKPNSRLPEALYFAPHFGRLISRQHPGVHEGISYIAKIEDIEIVETWKDLKRAIVHQRGRSWLKKNNYIINNISWLRRRKKRSVLFLDEPQLVFNPPVRKENLQSGSGWLSKHFLSFNILFKAWKEKQG